MKINLPCFIAVSDYHQFEYILNALNTVIVYDQPSHKARKKGAVSYIEIGHDGSNYQAYFYDSTKFPSDSSILSHFLEQQHGVFETEKDLRLFLTNSGFSTKYLRNLEGVMLKFSKQDGYFKKPRS